ncbi:MAG: hypothetical protein AAFY72_16025, partial [Cyanobacteria bacterium J06649_4]
MNRKKRPSRQRLIRAQQHLNFVGRVEQLESFQRNLIHLQKTEDGFLYPKDFVFNVWGQGGVGKTTLLRQFENVARQHNSISARVDEAVSNVPEAMAEFARQLADQGQSLPKFSERYKVYRQKREELETDPAAPKGFSALLGKSLARTGLSIARQVPIAGTALDLIDENRLVKLSEDWTSYVAGKLKNKDEVQLVNEPVEVLTPLFLEDINAIADKHIVLLFDTYERTINILEQWLLDILAERYEGLSLNCIWVIAGRNQLNPNRWSVHPLVQLPVEPFSVDEATWFLQQKGITNTEVIETILETSLRLPLLLAILAEGSPLSPSQVGEASSTIVERVLWWVDDPKKRQLAMDAALPQVLNRDIVGYLVDDTSKEDLFTWLQTLSFVHERSDGWTYHDVVRPQILRYLLRESNRRWNKQHQLLAKYHDDCCQQLQLDEEVCYADADWQRYMLQSLYHRLCSHPKQELSIALNSFLNALKQNPSFAQRWGLMMIEAGNDTQDKALRDWGEHIVNGLKAYEDGTYAETVTLFTTLLTAKDIEVEKLPIIYAWRGKVYSLISDYEKSLSDFNKAIELDGRYAWAIYSRGSLYFSRCRFKDALLDYSRAIELDSKD